MTMVQDIYPVSLMIAYICMVFEEREKKKTHLSWENIKNKTHTHKTIKQTNRHTICIQLFPFPFKYNSYRVTLRYQSIIINNIKYQLQAIIK